jgi:hypothetical protein
MIFPKYSGPTNKQSTGRAPHESHLVKINELSHRLARKKFVLASFIWCKVKRIIFSKENNFINGITKPKFEIIYRRSAAQVQ